MRHGSTEITRFSHINTVIDPCSSLTTLKEAKNFKSSQKNSLTSFVLTVSAIKLVQLHNNQDRLGLVCAACLLLTFHYLILIIMLEF